MVRLMRERNARRMRPSWERLRGAIVYTVLEAVWPASGMRIHVSCPTDEQWMSVVLVWMFVDVVWMPMEYCLLHVTCEHPSFYFHGFNSMRSFLRARNQILRHKSHPWPLE